jgi:hypothetical protein
MAVASHMPTSFVQYGPAESWGDRRLDPNNSNSQKIIDHYNDYAKALVRYIAIRAFAGGAQTAIFEVSNEIDIAADYPTCNRPNPFLSALLRHNGFRVRCYASPRNDEGIQPSR